MNFRRSGKTETTSGFLAASHFDYYSIWFPWYMLKNNDIHIITRNDHTHTNSKNIQERYNGIWYTWHQFPSFLPSFHCHLVLSAYWTLKGGFSPNLPKNRAVNSHLGLLISNVSPLKKKNTEHMRTKAPWTNIHLKLPGLPLKARHTLEHRKKHMSWTDISHKPNHKDPQHFFSGWWFKKPVEQKKSQIGSFPQAAMKPKLGLQNWMCSLSCNGFTSLQTRR